METEQKKQSRREFFLSWGRGGMLLGLATVSVFAVTKKPDADDESCDNNFICRKCATLKRCRLPQALSLKQALAQ